MFNSKKFQALTNKMTFASTLLAGISHKEIEKGCRFWHNSFVEK